MMQQFSSVIVLVSESNLELLTQARTAPDAVNAADRLTETIVCMHGHGAIIVPLDTFMNKLEITNSTVEARMVRKHALLCDHNVNVMHNMMQAWDAIGSFPMTSNSTQWIQMAHANNALPDENTWNRILPDGYVKTSEGAPVFAVCPFQCQHHMITCKSVSIERHNILDTIATAVYGIFGNRTLLIANPHTLHATFKMEYHDRVT